MHDDSVLVEKRIRRELAERVMPAMYSASMPLQIGPSALSTERA